MLRIEIVQKYKKDMLLLKNDSAMIEDKIINFPIRSVESIGYDLNLSSKHVLN